MNGSEREEKLTVKMSFVIFLKERERTKRHKKGKLRTLIRRESEEKKL